MGKLWPQLKVLLWRNVLLKRRNKRQLIPEFVMPIYFVSILALIKFSISPDVQPEVPGFPQHDLVNQSQLLKSSLILVAPDTPEVDAIMSFVAAELNVNYTLFSSQTAAEMFYMANPNAPKLGVIFYYNSDGSSLNFAVRAQYSQAPSPTSVFNYMNGGCRGDGLGWCDANKYLKTGFASLQLAISTALLRNQTSQSGLPLPDVSVKLMPKPLFVPDTSYIQIISAIYLVMAYSPFINFLVVNLVAEKEKKIREGMKMMGMRDAAFWLSWSIVYVCIIMVVTLIVVLIAAVSQFFTHSNMFLFFMMLFLYGLTIINLSFLLTPFFNKAMTAGALASFMSIVISLLYLVVSLTRTQTSMGEVDYSIPPSIRWILCLLSPVALALAIDQAIYLDIRHGGMSFETWGIGSMPLYDILLMLLLDTILYGALAIYFDNVIPSEYGQRRPPWYIFMPSYWCSKSPDVGEHSHLITREYGNHGDTGTVDPDDMEPVSADMHGKEGMRIVNIRKTFKGKDKNITVAVNGLTLDMYEGHITALLGHNGAGKTTLINMLTGMVPSTSGTAYVQGLDVSDPNCMEQIRSHSGVCPQHNILHDRLSAREHLRMFAILKGVLAANVDTAIEEALSDVDLTDRGDTMAEELSGGQKRKLSVAIALIGDPKVIFLDEPTAGMDPYSRRHLWTLLQARKKGRIILLTTHFMDEADILADRKAIISHGKLRCCGSSLFLKNRFGIGYHLKGTIKGWVRVLQALSLMPSRMVVEPDCQSAMVTNVLSRHVDGVKMLRSHGKELSYTLPLTQVDNFSALFAGLESPTDNGQTTASILGIKTYGVSMTTLEEVFLKLEEEVAEEATGDIRSEVNLSCTIDNGNHGNHANTLRSNNDSFTVEFSSSPSRVQISGGAPLSDITKQRFWALIKIRYLLLIRSRLAMIFQLFLPVAFVIIGVLVNKFAAPADDSAAPSSLSMQDALRSYVRVKAFPVNNVPPMVFQDSSDSALSADYLSALTGAVFVDQYNSSVNLLKQAPHHAGVNLSKLDITAQGFDLGFTVLYNDTAIHSLPVTLDLLMNALYGLIVGSTPANLITTFSLPWNRTSTQLNFSNSAFSASILISMAFVIIPAGFAVFIVRDRQFKNRSQLRVSGVTLPMYWGSCFLFNMGQYCIPAVLCVIIVLAAQVETLAHGGAVVSLIILFICYMPMAILISYTTSFAFEKFETCQSVLPNVFLFSSMLPYIAIALVDMIVSEGTARTLHQVFCVIDPPYLIFGGIYYIDRIHRVKLLTNTEVLFGDYFQWNNNILIVFIMALVHCGWLYLLLRLLDVRSTGGDPKDVIRCKSSGVSPSRVVPEINDDKIQHEDADVTEERLRVEKIQNEPNQEVPVVLVKNLRKEFKSREKTKSQKGSSAGVFSCCSKEARARKIKVAVRNGTFAVSTGEVFGLLGPNGAGKTTTINMIIAEEGANRGKIEVAGHDVRSSLSEAFQAMGYCPQHDALWERITLREHLHCYAAVRGIPPRDIPALTDNYMEALKVMEHADKHSDKLSGGTKRKLSYAMSMLGNPRVVLLDEPSTGMDPQSKRFLWDTISSSFLGKERGAILTTHYMEEADALCSRIAIMVNGQLQCLGSTQHLKNKYGSGYMLEVKLDGKQTDGRSTDERMTQFEEYIKERFPGAVCSEKFGERAQFKIPKENITSLGKTFLLLEEAKVENGLGEYSFSQSTLEQVFLAFAKKQLEEGMEESRPVTAEEAVSSRPV